MLPFRDTVEHWNADGHINCVNDQATTGINLVGFWSEYPEYTRIMCTVQQASTALGLVYLHLLGGSTDMFCYYLIGGDTVVPSWLYARLCHAFLVSFFFFLMISRRQIISGSAGRFLQSFHRLETIWVQIIDLRCLYVIQASLQQTRWKIEPMELKP